MDNIRKISQILFLVPLGLFLFDLVANWFVEARIHVRSFLELWKDIDPQSIPAIQAWALHYIPAEHWKAMMDAPAPLVLLVPPTVLYVIYRIVFAISGGSGSDRYRFRSRH